MQEAEVSKVNQISCQLTTGAARLGTANNMGRRMKPRRGTAAYNLANKTVSSKKPKKSEVKVNPASDSTRNLIDAGTLPEFVVKGRSPYKRGTARHTLVHRMHSKRRGLL